MTLRTSFIIDLAGNLQSRANQFNQSLNRLGTGGSRSMQILNRSITAAGRGLDRLGNRYTALITGAAGIGAARQVANLEERLTRLGIQANVTDEVIGSLKGRIFDLANASDIRVDPGQIISAIEEIVEKTGDLKFAQDNIRNIGLAIKATGAEGQSIGGIMAEFQKMGMGAKEAFQALDILTVQGKEGAFTLQNLAALGPRVVTAYTSMGRTGVPAIREMGAALQVIRQGTGSSEMAATAFEAVVRTFGNAKKVGMLQAQGIKVFDPVALKQGKEILRPINELMVEIVKKTGGKKTLLSQVFDEEAIRAFNAMASEYQRTGNVTSMDKFYKVQADGSVITQDSARAAKTANAAMTSLLTTWKKFADRELTKPIQDLTKYLDSLKPGTVERWMNIAKYAAMIGGGLILARKGFGLFQAGRDLLTGGKGGAGGLGGGMGGVVPVYVVNKMFPGGFPMGGEIPGAPGKTGKVLGTVGKYAKYAGAVGLAGAAGYGVGSLINKYLIDGTALGNAIGEGLNRIAAALGNKESKLAIELNSKDGSTARITSMQSKGMSLSVDNGLMMRSH